jgi:cytosine/adenosine deaminase-related metal-dependent hydrolase
VHSLLHCHFESGLRALAVAQPAQLAWLRPVFETLAYKHAAPAGRLRLLDQQAEHLTRTLDIFTPRVFAKVARRFWVEMTSSGVTHVDLRIGVIMHRWPWINSLTDAITAFRAELPGDVLTVSFLGAVNLSRPHDVLDVVFGRVLEDAASAGLLAGVDLNMLPADLPTLDRYLGALRDLQRGGLHVNIHLGEFFGPALSRLVLSRIIPSRIGHGVLLLDDPEIAGLIRENRICLDMCPVSNTRLGVHDWISSSPAADAMRLGLPVTVNTDDPLLFGAGLAENLELAGLSPEQLETARLTASKYRCGP